MSKPTPPRIEYQGRYYEYSAIDDHWYPLPTKDSYDFQRFVLFIGTVILVCWIISLFFNK